MKVHEVVHPFCRFSANGDHWWSIGCEVETDHFGGDQWYAHAEGMKVITEISRHTPPGFGEKVFFTVQYVDPDGNLASRKRLHMLGLKAFNRRVAGFIHDYDLEP